ncbi:MAG: DUF2147 domain-containing protein [Marinilabiliales bacterium]|nr:DUF2147 domain-containing protein [Marinilabiliales bacterium]
MSSILIAGLLFLAGQLSGQDVTGKWRTIDDETGKQKSIVQIWISGNQAFGKILETWDDDEVTPTDKTCDKCPGNLKDKRIHGMIIINGLKKDDTIWKGKKGILDPNNGKFYDVKIMARGSEYADSQRIHRTDWPEADLASRSGIAGKQKSCPPRAGSFFIEVTLRNRSAFFR